MASKNIIVRPGAKTFWFVLILIVWTTGFFVGASISQPMLLAQPTREVLTQADDLDRVLLGELRDPRDITDELHKLKAATTKLPNGQGADIVAGVDLISSKLVAQNASFQQSVWKAHEAVSAVHAKLMLQAEAANDRVSVAYDQLRRFLKWTGPALALAVLFLAIAASHPSVREWLSRATTVGLGPLSVVVGNVDALKQSVKGRFTEVDAAIVATYKDKIDKFDLEGLFTRLKIEIDKQLKTAFGVEMAQVKHRATMFVPGFTNEQLVQVTKYTPPENPERAVVGRRFSVRYGIIGRAFRLRTALYNWDVNNEQNNLVRYWGLTRTEAWKQDGRATSLLALPIPPDQNVEPVAIVYIEAAGSNLLMPNQCPRVLEELVLNDPDGRTKADMLANDKIWMPLWNAKAVQPLYEALQAMKAEFKWDTPLEGKDGQ